LEGGSLCMQDKEFLVSGCRFPATMTAQILESRFSFRRVLSLIILQNPDDTVSMSWRAATDRARLLGMKALWRTVVKSIASGRLCEGHFWPRFQTQLCEGRWREGATKVPERGVGLGACFSLKLKHTECFVCRWHTGRIARPIFGNHLRGLSDGGARVADDCRAMIELAGPQDKEALIRQRAGKAPTQTRWVASVEVVP
jgi:hypothetical protein